MVKAFGFCMKEPLPAKKYLAHPILHLFLIAFLGAAIYSLTFHVPFVFDDRTSIVENTVIRDLHRFLGPDGYHLHPRRFFGYLTFALNYRFGGLHVAGYHLVNLLIHLTTASLVYGLCRLTFRTPRMRESALAPNAPYIALFAGLLFVAHPVQTEAVTYITQRLASLSTALYLLALVLWVCGKGDRLLFQMKSEKVACPLFLVGAALAGFAAMLTKEIAVTLPFTALIYGELFFVSSRRKKLADLLPLVLAVLFPFLLWHLAAPSGRSLDAVLDHARGGTGVTRWDYLVTQPRVIVTYLRLLFYPAGLNLDYDYPVYHSLFALPVAGSLLLLLPPAGLTVWLARCAASGYDAGLRLISFGIAFFFAALLVESSVIPLDDLIAEHRLYLPSAGFFLACAASGGFLARRVGGARILLLATCVVLALGAATVRRNIAWQSPLALWRDTVAKSPGKARPRYNLGTVLNDRGAHQDAILQLREALRIKPEYADAWHNLGVAHAARGDLAEAIEKYRQALRFDPGMARAHNSLGVALVSMGGLDEAIAEYRRAVEIDPDYGDARNNLGAAYGMQGRVDEAVSELERSVRLDPGNRRFHLNLARAYELKGWKEKAEAERRLAEGHK